MVVQDFTTAQIRIILISDDKAQAQHLLRDMQASKYVYGFTLVDDGKALLKTLALKVAEFPALPTVMVINYSFAGGACAEVLRLARSSAGQPAIACIVTHPPAQAALRKTLSELGATLYDEGSDLPLLSASLH